MITPEQLLHQRQIEGQTAEMQKLFVTGHLLIGADVSAPHISDFLNGLGEVCGMNIFAGPYIKTPDFYDHETYLRLGNRPPEDINGSVMWDDSGAQMYVFPNRKNWCTVDVYTCKQFDPQRTLRYTYEYLGFREDMRYSTSTIEGNTSWLPFTLPDGKPLNPEENLLPQLDQLLSINHSERGLINAGLTLEQLVAQAIIEGYGNRLADSYTPEQVTAFQRLHGEFEVATDYRFINDVLLSVAHDPDQYPLQPVYSRLSRIEAESANLERGKPVLHIGTGWPGTAIGLYRQFGIPVTCIERDPEFAQKSQDALGKLGLLGRNRLRVVNVDGCDISTQDYQAVIVSAMVPNEDKEEIIWNMRRLATGSSSDPKLILRTPADRARALLYQQLDRAIINYNLNLFADTAPHIGLDPLRSLVFTVKGMSRVLSGVDESSLINAKTRLQVV